MDDAEGTALPSKSSRKRDAAHLRALGERLVQLGDGGLARLPLPEPVADAVADYQRFSTREARRRQLSRLGKMLRASDTDAIAAIEARLAEIDIGSAREARRQHAAEDWRERLLADAGALDEFMAECPQADRNRLRALLRRAAGDRAAGDRAAFRELFRELRATLASHAGED